jgi:hypothetical protein
VGADGTSTAPAGAPVVGAPAAAAKVTDEQYRAHRPAIKELIQKFVRALRHGDRPALLALLSSARSEQSLPPAVVEALRPLVKTIGATNDLQVKKAPPGSDHDLVAEARVDFQRGAKPVLAAPIESPAAQAEIADVPVVQLRLTLHHESEGWKVHLARIEVPRG